MAFFRKNDRRFILDLPISEIVPNPKQPRQIFDPDSLQELSQSIASLGILQPLSVRRADGRWELVAGERRLRAAELAGLHTVPCIQVDVDDETSALLALVENLQRRDLDVWEEAEALQLLISEFHLSQEEAAQRVGKSQSAVANKLRLLKLPEDVIQALRASHLSERHARALLRLDDPVLQRSTLQYILDHKLTVSLTEEYIDRLLSPPQPPATPSPARRPVTLYRIKDVRLFLNTIQKSLTIMQSAGVAAECGRIETDSEITLTIRIPKTASANMEALAARQVSTAS